jgi:hypothetical protein
MDRVWPDRSWPLSLCLRLAAEERDEAREDASPDDREDRDTLREYRSGLGFFRARECGEHLDGDGDEDIRSLLIVLFV